MNSLLFEVVPWVRAGYGCSQILLLLMLKLLDRKSTDVLKAGYGLCYGLGQSGGVCGLLTGGACALGLVVGKGEDQEEVSPKAQSIIYDYALWFEERVAIYGGTSCPMIAAGLGGGGQTPNLLACGDLLSECWEKILTLMQDYELDL